MSLVCVFLWQFGLSSVKEPGQVNTCIYKLAYECDQTNLDNYFEKGGDNLIINSAWQSQHMTRSSVFMT